METGQKTTVTTTKTKEQSFIKLSIQVSLNGLSFCALDRDRHTIVFFKDVRFVKKLNPVQVLKEIEKIYDQESFLEKEFSEVEILFSNELYSVVPQQVFQEENSSDYLKYNTKILETDFVAQDHLEDAGLVTVYIPYTNINNFFFDKYGEFDYRHCVSILLEELLKQNKDQKAGSRVYLNRNASGYDLIVIRKGKLIFSNSFLCDTKEDFIYYLLFTAEQLELDPQEFELILLGKITENSDYYDITYTYIKNIRFLQTAFGYVFDVDTDVPKGYQYFTLLTSLQ